MTIKKEGYRTKDFCKEYIEIELNKNNIIKAPRYPLSKTNRIAETATG